MTTPLQRMNGNAPTAPNRAVDQITEYFNVLTSMRWADPLALGKLHRISSELKQTRAVHDSDLRWMEQTKDHIVNELPPKPPEWFENPMTAPADTTSTPLSPSNLAWLNRMDVAPTSSLSHEDAAHMAKLIAETQHTADRPFVTSVTAGHVNHWKQATEKANARITESFATRPIHPTIRDGFRDAIERTLTNSPELLDPYLAPDRADNPDYRTNVARDIATTTVDSQLADRDTTPIEPPATAPEKDPSIAERLNRGRQRSANAHGSTASGTARKA